MSGAFRDAFEKTLPSARALIRKLSEPCAKCNGRGWYQMVGGNDWKKTCECQLRPKSTTATVAGEM